MAIDITDRYKLIFEEHHYASDFRVKIIQAWCLCYVAFAAGLGWTQANPAAKTVSWVFSALACVITVFMWVADFRHRGALANSKMIGRAIEESDDANIPSNQRFFAKITSGWLTHSLAIDVSAGFMLAVLSRVSTFWKGNHGDLTSLPPDIICWAVGGSVLGAGFYVIVHISLAKRRLRERCGPRRVVVLGTSHRLQGAGFPESVDDPDYVETVNSIISVDMIDFIFEEASGREKTTAKRLADSLESVRYLDVDPDPTVRHQFGIKLPSGKPFPITVSSEQRVAEATQREALWCRRIGKQDFKNGLVICGVMHTVSVASRLRSAGFTVKFDEYIPHDVLCSHAKD